jgi:hypothetical protein
MLLKIVISFSLGMFLSSGLAFYIKVLLPVLFPRIA